MGYEITFSLGFPVCFAHSTAGLKTDVIRSTFCFGVIGACSALQVGLLCVYEPKRLTSTDSSDRIVSGVKASQAELARDSLVNTLLPQIMDQSASAAQIAQAQQTYLRWASTAASAMSYNARLLLIATILACAFFAVRYVI